MSLTEHATTTTLYERVGGAAAIDAAVDLLYAKLTDDPEVGRYFPGGPRDRHRAQFKVIFGQALGGPECYEGPDLIDIHRRLRITDRHFDVTAGHLVATLDELGVDPVVAGEIVAIVASLRDQIVTADPA